MWKDGQSLRYVLPVFFFFLVWTGCTNEKYSSANTLVLSWPRSYVSQDWATVQKGLAWGISFLGADLPRGSLDFVFQKTGDNGILFDPSRAGFDEHAWSHLLSLMDVIKESEEYRQKQSVDLGRFLMYVVFSPYHYYAITAAEPTLAAFRNKYASASHRFYVATNSGVSKGDRLISFHLDADISKMYFLAEEGNGSVLSGTFTPESYEALTVMKNGQLRFTIYDKSGHLLDAADSSRTLAGKPGKCMWCHEANFLPLFSPNPDVPGYLSTAAFLDCVDSARNYLSSYRNMHSGAIDFFSLQDHARVEWLYLGFMEPSSYRLAQEWNMSEVDVKELLKALPTHSNPEYTFSGVLFNRMDTDPFAPFLSLPVPYSVREKSVYEPDYFHLHP